jgi:hypothetical protein
LREKPGNSPRLMPVNSCSNSVNSAIAASTSRHEQAVGHFQMLDVCLIQRERPLPDAAICGRINELRMSRLVPARGRGWLAQLQAHAIRPHGDRRPGMRKHARFPNPNPGGGSRQHRHACPAGGCAIRRNGTAENPNLKTTTKGETQNESLHDHPNAGP